MKSLLPFFLLAFSAHCFGQSSATDIIQSNLITAPEHVGSGGYFTVRTPPGLEYKIYPEPKEFFRTLEEGTGVRVLFVLYADPIDPADPEPDPKKKRRLPGYVITINHAVIHPTEEELAGAPTVSDPKDAAQVKTFKEYLRKHSADEIFQDSHTVKVGEGPGPGPNPPGPDPPVPPPGPAPIPLAGLRVMIVEEQSERHKLSAGHQSIMFGKPFRDYLNSVCTAGVKVPAKKEWRIYEKDMDVSADGEHWAKALARPKTSYPWIVISNGTSGFEGSLPSDPQAAMELINKYKVQQ